MVRREIILLRDSRCKFNFALKGEMEGEKGNQELFTVPYEK
jgi:hypothetical protein